MGTIDTSLQRIYDQLRAGNAGLAIMELETYLMAWPNQQSREKLETLRSEYDLMADYWMQGATDPERAKQLQLFVKAYNQACDSINKNGFQHYRDLIMQHCNVKKEVVDSLPDVKKNPYIIGQGPRQEDVTQIEKWLGVKKVKKDDKKSETVKGRKVKGKKSKGKK